MHSIEVVTQCFLIFIGIRTLALFHQECLKESFDIPIHNAVYISDELQGLKKGIMEMADIIAWMM